MSAFAASDLCVIIPTRDRWNILGRTLDALVAQSVSGFDLVVVVDGLDQVVPSLEGARVLSVKQGGPGAARNQAARSTDKRLVLFLGDDMIPAPDLIEKHLATHSTHPDEDVAVLGHASWHPEVAQGRINRWMDESGTQFDFESIVDGDAGFGRFYSCNVSLKRTFFLDAGGFDEDFTYYYEDLDCGWRLGQKGMRLLYVPDARSFHLHQYDLASLKRRFRGVGVGERLIAAKHPWFEPFFLERVRRTVENPKPSPLWQLIAPLVPTRASKMHRLARSRLDAWYYHSLSDPFLAGWASAADLAELHEYLGERFDNSRLVGHQQEVDSERASAKDEISFYRTSEAYLYDLTVFAMSDTKAPYLAELRSVVPPGGRLLDYGCGIGADGLRLASAGYAMSFADFANPSAAFLRWRLERRGLKAPVFDIESDDIPTGFDAAYAFDVIEHVEDPFAFLARLERHADLVIVNLLEEEPEDIELHRPLPIRDLIEHASRFGLLRYRRYHDRSHLIIYRSPTGRNVGRTHSVVQRHLGSHLRGMPGWHPLPQV
jgi:GT2 family glycosyltransferase